MTSSLQVSTSFVSQRSSKSPRLSMSFVFITLYRLSLAHQRHLLHSFDKLSLYCNVQYKHSSRCYTAINRANDDDDDDD